MRKRQQDTCFTEEAEEAEDNTCNFWNCHKCHSNTKYEKKRELQAKAKSITEYLTKHDHVSIKDIEIEWYNTTPLTIQK